MALETHIPFEDTYLIDRIDFSVYNNADILRHSAVEEGINIPEAYENQEPKTGGLIDKRLGVTDYNMVCDTCGLPAGECPGHFGHTELAEEVFHYGYLDKIDIIKNILSCICLNCSKPLIPKDKNKKELNDSLQSSFGKNRFASIKKLTSNVKYCQYPDNNCGKPVGKLTKEILKTGKIELKVSYLINASQGENEEKVTVIGKKSKYEEILSPSRVYKIFQNISDDDCRLLGFDPIKSRPENFIIKIFPIPPVAIRPSVRLEILSGPSEDTLTMKIAAIIKTNNKLKKQIEGVTGDEEAKHRQEYVQLLQYEVATYFDNDSKLPKSLQKGQREIKSIAERLKGKTGRIRGNCMGN